MASTYWTTLMVGSLLAGIGAASALAFSRSREPLAALAGIAGVVMSAWSIGRLTALYANPRAALVGLMLTFGGIVGGYALAAVTLPRATRTRVPRALSASRGDRTAVLLLSDAEPETYDVASTARELVELEDDQVLELGIVSTPFLFLAQKARYRAVGGTSPARRQVNEVAESLERALTGLGVDHVGTAWCDEADDLADRVQALSWAGYSRFAVVPLSVGESLELERAKQMLDRARPIDAGILVAYAEPLCASEGVAGLLARRIAVGIDDGDTTGVALVAHGQPESREQLKATLDSDEVAFTNRVKMLLADRGVPTQNVGITWADWREPSVTTTVRHLGALGCTRVLVCPACFPVDCIATMLDVPMAVRHSRVEPAVSVITLSTWRDEEEVIAALREAVIGALAELDAPRA